MPCIVSVGSLGGGKKIRYLHSFGSNAPGSPIAGAAEKISTLRYRYQEVSDSIAQLEARVAKNAAQLERLNRSYGDPDDDREPFEIRQPDTVDITDEDIERELDEIHELEQKKRVLEDRVTGLERDLGGLRR